MKLKKSQIFWICLYAAELALVTLIVFSQRAHWYINGFSAFPVIYSVICVILGCWFPTYHFYRVDCERYVQWCCSNFKYVDLQKLDQMRVRKEQDGSWKSPYYRTMANLVFALIPFFALFFFFFVNGAKVASFVFAFLIYLLGMIIYLFFFDGDPKFHQKRKERLARELKEQKEREELGKWK
ncbi:MAG: hypothetical protein IJW22_08295 [Clostridia bacterium]|nr:hypothetical protein [Clostridia bacterium]